MTFSARSTVVILLATVKNGEAASRRPTALPWYCTMSKPGSPPALNAPLSPRMVIGSVKR